LRHIWMGNELHLKLGAGKAKAYKVGNKGGLLDKAADAGLRVPEGILLLDTVWDQAMLYGYIEVHGGQVIALNPDGLLKFLQLPPFPALVAVRSAFSLEDRIDQSFAGYFKTVLRVDPTNAEQVAAALCEVLTSALQMQVTTMEVPVVPANLSLPPKTSKPFRRDVLVMAMVDAERAGVAFTEREYEDDLVNFTKGTGEKLVGGEVEGESFLLPKLRGWELSHPIGVPVGSWQARLQALLRDVRRWMGKADWDIEWADDGEHCYLLQLRPITRAIRRNEAFTIANHKEILPPLPSVFMTSVVESCAGALFGYYRNFDSTLPKTRHFIEVFAGRPFINLSLMSEMMRIFGLPTRMVTDNIGGEAGQSFPLNWQRMLSKIVTLTLPRFALAQVLSVQSSRRAIRQMERRTKDLSGSVSYSELVETMRWLYMRLGAEMFSLTAAIAPMLSLLRRFGTLHEHSARQQTISTAMYTELAPLRKVAAKDTEALLAGKLPESPAFQTLWQNYLAKYGHRGIYESDVSRPRYREDPTPLLMAIAAPIGKPDSVPKRTLKGWLTLLLWWQASRTMQAREMWRHEAMRGFGRVRAAMLEKAAKTFETPEDIWMLTVDEVRKLDEGWQPDEAFWGERRAEIERLKSYELPDLIHRLDDLEQYRERGEDEPQVERLTGVSLTSGQVHGRAWVLSEPSVTLPEGFKPEETILVARSVDAGWIPTFAKVAGVVVETGGDLSHGSIILREIGLPAITNARRATKAIQTGEGLLLRAESGVVDIVN
jgi:rifampicin phosphotransferase